MWISPLPVPAITHSPSTVKLTAVIASFVDPPELDDPTGIVCVKHPVYLDRTPVLEIPQLDLVVCVARCDERSVFSTPETRTLDRGFCRYYELNNLLPAVSLSSVMVFHLQS